MEFTAQDWFDVVVMAICAILIPVAAIGWYRRHSQWEDDKAMHRRLGGTAPEKIPQKYLKK